jgi:hypothetical protein
MFHLLQARDPAAGTQHYLVDARSGADIEVEELEPAVSPRPS